MTPSVDRAFTGRAIPTGQEALAPNSARHLTHAVPDKSMKSMVLDMSDLHGTNVWLGEAELVKASPGEVGCHTGLVEWLSKGCYATMLPVDGRDRIHIEWMAQVMKKVILGLLAQEGKRRVGLVWKRCDGEDSDLLGRVSLLSMSTKDSINTLQRTRSNSARMRPRVVVEVANESDVDVVLRAVVDLNKGRIKDDCVVSVVLLDEEECIFSMLNFVVARSRLSFLNLVSLVEEIGMLHQAGKAGDFRLQCAQLTDLNKLASMYLDGNTKIYVISYPQQEDFSFVDAIASVCAGDQTVRTDIQWVDPRDIPEYRTNSLYSKNTDGTPSEGSGRLESPSIEAMRESLKVQTAAEHFSAAAQRAMSRILEEESPTNPKTGMDKSVPRGRMLHFSSLRSPISQQHDQQEGWIPVDRSRDIFSSLHTISDDYNTSTQHIESDDVIESISLQRPTTSTDEYLVPEFVEHPDDEQGNQAQGHSWVYSKTNVKEDVYNNIDRKVNEKLVASIGELQEQLKWSEMQRHQLEAKVEALSAGLDAGWRQANHPSLVKALAEERKSSKHLNSLVMTMKQEKLAQEVELASKDKELCIARARIQYLQSHTDIRKAFELCEHEVEMAQEEARYLRKENAGLAKKLAMLDISNTVQSHCPILPEDEEYDVNGAEGRIIYKLHEKVKSLQGKVSKANMENADMRRALEQAKRDERKHIVTKKVAKDALAKLSKKIHVQCY